MSLSTGEGLGVLDTYTVEGILFPETLTLLQFPELYPSLVGSDRSNRVTLVFPEQSPCTPPVCLLFNTVVCL